MAVAGEIDKRKFYTYISLWSLLCFILALAGSASEKWVSGNEVVEIKVERNEKNETITTRVYGDDETYGLWTHDIIKFKAFEGVEM